MVDYLRTTSHFEHLKLKFNQHWVDSQIDVLLLPGFAVPAIKHTQSKVPFDISSGPLLHASVHYNLQHDVILLRLPPHHPIQMARIILH
jgi:hypothetical protein